MKKNYFLVIIGILVTIFGAYFIYMTSKYRMSYVFPALIFLFGILTCFRGIRNIRLINSGQSIPEKDILKQVSHGAGIFGILLTIIAIVFIVYAFINLLSLWQG